MRFGDFVIKSNQHNRVKFYDEIDSFYDRNNPKPFF